MTWLAFWCWLWSDVPAHSSMVVYMYARMIEQQWYEYRDGSLWARLVKAHPHANVRLAGVTA